MVVCRAIGPEHRLELAAFRCVDAGETWAEEIEQTIREDLADKLDEAREYWAKGLWVDDRLVAVNAWGPLPWADNSWYSTILAVDPRYRRRRFAIRLKRELLEAAAAAGVAAVVSKVRLDNAPMLELNRRFKAKLRPDYESGYCWCSITV